MGPAWSFSTCSSSRTLRRCLLWLRHPPSTWLPPLARSPRRSSTPLRISSLVVSPLPSRRRLLRPLSVSSCCSRTRESLLLPRLRVSTRALLMSLCVSQGAGCWCVLAWKHGQRDPVLPDPGAELYVQGAVQEALQGREGRVVWDAAVLERGFWWSCWRHVSVRGVPPRLCPDAACCRCWVWREA